MIRVALADSQRLLRQGVRSLLSRSPDLEVVGEAEEGPEALALTRRVCPDVILMDAHLPGAGATEVVQQLGSSTPDLRVVILTTCSFDQCVRPLLASGVRGYLLKDMSGDQLVAALARVQRGERVISREVDAQTGRGARRSPGRLSDRELEVLKLVGFGASNKEIAHNLGVTNRTVETFVSRAFAKLDVRSRTEAVRAAVERGIIHPGY